MYGVKLARQKNHPGYDLTDSLNRKVQVKTRAATGSLSGRKFHGVGKGRFDVCLFLCVDDRTYRPHLARELDALDLEPLLDKDGAVTYSRIRMRGKDLLGSAVAAYETATG